MIDKLDEYLPEKRKIHSINVSKSAVRLAKILGCDEKKAEIAGILHDTAKYVKYEDVPKYIFFFYFYFSQKVEREFVCIK